MRSNRREHVVACTCAGFGAAQLWRVQGTSTGYTRTICSCGGLAQSAVS